MLIKINRQPVRTALLLILAVSACLWAQQRKKITVPNDYPTIQRALGEADEGDTVFVRNGVYKENITLADDVILLGQDKKSTIIDGRRKAPVVVAADGAVIANFTIRNGTTGILCKNTRPMIRDNIIIDNKGTGVHALVVLPDIVNNVIYRNLWTGIFLESVRGTRTSISNNVIMENGYHGIFGANKTEVLVRNNIIHGNKQFGIFLGPDARKTRIVGNNIYKNRQSFNANADNQSVRQQNISADPHFANLALLNFNVKSNSPCKGKGEEGADIGLSETVVTAAPESKFKPSSELDEYFPSSGSDYRQEESYEPAPSYEPPPLTRDAPMEITETIVLHGVDFKTTFGSESAELEEGSYEVLDKLYASLAYYTNLKIEIAGHTDDRGGDDFNRKLSLDRARAVMNYLVGKGIDRNRIRARGYGMDRPVSSNYTEEGRADNRRVEVIPLK